MELILQPKGSYKCTQCCVAMVAGVSLKKSIQAFGLSHATNLYAMRNALKKLGFESAEKYKSFGRKAKKLPDTCILWMQWKGRKVGHCVVFHREKDNDEGQVYDPGCGTAPWDLFLLLNSGAALSYLAINPA